MWSADPDRPSSGAGTSATERGEPVIAIELPGDNSRSNGSHPGPHAHHRSGLLLPHLPGIPATNPYIFHRSSSRRLYDIGVVKIAPSGMIAVGILLPFAALIALRWRRLMSCPVTRTDVAASTGFKIRWIARISCNVDFGQ